MNVPLRTKSGWRWRGNLLPVMLLLFVTGCANESGDPVSLPSWRQSVEQYVWDQGNGDPTVLRDMSWDDVHKGFAVMSDPLPRQSDDIIGLLVAHRVVEGQPYFVFLVASVYHQSLTELRPVALNVAAGDFHWINGSPSAPAYAAYKRWSDAEKWLGNANDPAPPPFPVPGDTFNVSINGDRVSIRHPESGASWEMRVPAAATRPSTDGHSNSSSSFTSRSK